MCVCLRVNMHVTGTLSHCPPTSPNQDDLNLPEEKQQLVRQMAPELQWQMVQSHFLTSGKTDSAKTHLETIRNTFSVCNEFE